MTFTTEIRKPLILLSLLTIAASLALTQNSPCDLNKDGVTSVVDVQLAINMDLGLLTCTANIAGLAVCNVVVVQRIVNAALGGACVVNHFVSLTWTASTSPNISGYNIYRSNTTGGPYTKVTTSSLVSGTSYTDNNATAGQTYYYVATAVDTRGAESAYSNEAPATVPSP
jgi:hypothetical protein